MDRSKIFFTIAILLSAFVTQSQCETVYVPEYCLGEYTRGSLSKPCGYCFVCKKKMASENNTSASQCLSVTRELSIINPLWPFKVMSYNRPKSKFCTVSTSCFGKCKCKNARSTSGSESKQVCMEFIASCKCGCPERRYGQQCDFNIPIGLTKNSFADIQGILYVPYMYSTDINTVFIYFYNVGDNLKVKFESSREILSYNSESCQRQYTEHFHEHCFRIYKDSGVSNIKLICERAAPTYTANKDNLICRVAVNLAFPRSEITPWNEKEFILGYNEENYENKSIVAKKESITVTIENDIHELTEGKVVFTHQIPFVVIYAGKTIYENCQIFLAVRGFKNTMFNMPIFPRKKALILSSSVFLGNSPQCEYLKEPTLNWFIWRVSKNHDERNDDPLIDKFQTEELVLDPFSLDYGVYKVKHSIEYQNIHNKGLNRGTTYCYFKIVQLQVQPLIVGGSLRHIFYKSKLEFTTTELAEPNYPWGDQPTLIYAWSCNDTSQYVCKNKIKTTNPTLTISGPFNKSIALIFTMEVVSPLPPTVYSSQVIVFTEDPVPNLLIECLRNCGGEGFESDSREIFYFRVKHSIHSVGKTNANYKWAYMKGLNSGSSTTRSSFTDVADVRQEEEKPEWILIVDENKFPSDQLITFRVTGGSDFPGEAQIIVKTFELLGELVCKVNPKNGESGKTKFYIKCEQSKDEQNQLTFMFYDKLNKSKPDEGRMLGSSLTGLLNDVILTRGVVAAFATNMYGHHQEAYIDVDLTQPDVTRTFLDKSMKILRENNGGDEQKLSFISAISDVLNQNLDLKKEVVESFLKTISEKQVTDLARMELVLLTTQQVICDMDQCTTPELSHSGFQSLGKILSGVAKRFSNELTSHGAHTGLTTFKINFLYKTFIECVGAILTIRDETIIDKRHPTIDFSIYEIYKTISLKVVESLDDVNRGLVSRNLPYIRHYSVETKYIETWMKEDTPQFFKKGTQKDSGLSLNSFVKISQALSKLLEEDHSTVALQTMVFDKDPFWWSQTDEVTTAVVSLTLSLTPNSKTDNNIIVNKQFANRSVSVIGLSSTTIGSSIINNFSIKNFGKPIDIFLHIKNNNKFLTTGKVAQPNATADIDIKDMSIVVHRVYPPKGSVVKIKFINLNEAESLRIYVSVNERPDYEHCFHGLNITKSSPEFDLRRPIDSTEDIVYIGLLPGPNVSVGETMNYTFELQSIRCQVWHISLWTTTGCRLGIETTDEILHCQCYHLSYVAGFLGVPMNIVDPFSDYKLFLTLPENPYVFVLVLSILLMFLLFLILAIVADKQKKQQMGIIVLEDNISTDRFGYLVTVFTGCELFSGSSANIAIVLHGSDASSRPHLLRSSTRETLQRDNDDWFLLFAPNYLGTLQFIEIWTDHSGLKPNWFCDKLYVTDLTTTEDYMFIVRKWFGITQFGTTTQLVSARVQVVFKDLTHFVVHFASKCLYGFRERHSWISIFARHPRSMVPSSQRLSLSVVTLLTIILSGLLFYNAATGYEDYFAYDVTFREVLIAFYSLCISILFTYPVYFAFSKTKAYHEIKENSTDNSEKRYKKWKFRGTKMKIDNADALLTADKSKINVEYFFKRTLLKYRKESFLPVKLSAKTKPLAKMYIVQNKYRSALAWTLCGLIIFVLSYFIALIGLKIGKVKSQLWLTSVGLSLSQDVFLLDPIKIIVIAVLFGCLQTQICDLYGYDPNVYEMRQGTEVKRRYVRDHHVYLMRLMQPYRPLSGEKLKNVQRQQVKIKTWWNFINVTDIFFSVLSLFFIISIDISEYNTVSLISNMIPGKIQSYEDGHVFTNLSTKMLFIQSIVLPAIYCTRWYNGESFTSDDERFEETGWAQDATHRLMGVPRLRQARVATQSCDLVHVLKNSTLNCTMTLRRDTEDTGDYGSLWGPPVWDDIVFKQSPWVYNSPKESGSIDVYAGSGTLYHGGGYIAELQRTQRESSNTILNLVDAGWLDVRTRCVFFELSVYNVNSHILTSVVFLTEHLKSSISITTSLIWSVSMDDQKYVFWIVVYFLYASLAIIKLFIVFNTIGTRKFFSNFWTVYDLCTVVFGIICFISFRILLAVALVYVEDLQRRGKDEFFKFHSLTYYLQLSKTLMGFLFILTSARALRLLKYNNINTFKKLKSTLYFSWNKLLWISAMLFVSLYVLQQMAAFLLNFFCDFKVLMHRMSYKYLQLSSFAVHCKAVAFLLCFVPYTATFMYATIILKSYSYSGRLVKR